MAPKCITYLVYHTLSQKRSYKHKGGSLVILDNDGKQNQKLSISVIFKKN